jgi:hypothetical protein
MGKSGKKTPKSRINIRANQNTGIEIPAVAKTMLTIPLPVKNWMRQPQKFKVDITLADGAVAGGRATGTADLDDPIHLEILWNRMIAAVDEAAASLLRSAFSTVVRESYDFSCVVTDANGNALAQASDSIPSFIGTLPDTVKHFIAAFPPETLSPGDVLITNDPHMGTGHLPDISVCRPLFSGSALVGFAAENRDLIRILFSRESDVTEVQTDVLQLMANRASVVRRQLVDERRMPAEIDPDVFAQALIGMWARVVAWWAEDTSRAPREVVIETLTQIQLHGTHPEPLKPR